MQTTLVFSIDTLSYQYCTQIQCLLIQLTTQFWVLIVLHICIIKCKDGKLTFSLTSCMFVFKDSFITNMIEFLLHVFEFRYFTELRFSQSKKACERLRLAQLHQQFGTRDLLCTQNTFHMRRCLSLDANFQGQKCADALCLTQGVFFFFLLIVSVRQKACSSCTCVFFVIKKPICSVRR